MAAPLEHYIPKPNKLWARVPTPLTLKDLAMRQVLKNISTVTHPLPDGEETELRQYLATNLLPEFFRDLIQLSHALLLKPLSLLDVLYAVPRESYESFVDLLGFYEGTECCKPGNSSHWMFGNLPDICLDVNGCQKLVRLLRNMDLEKLKTIRVWARDEAIYNSRFPRIFVKAVNLTRLTLRGDACDHVLRIIGANCHSLQHLDIARSNGVTNYGLYNLFLKKRVGVTRGAPLPTAESIRDAEVRPIASTLESLTLTKYGLGLENLLLLAHLIDSYLSSQLPEANFRRVRTIPGQTPLMALANDVEWIGIPTQVEPLRTVLEAEISAEVWAPLERIVTSTLAAAGDCQLDVYRDQFQPGVFEIYAHGKDEWLLCVVYKISTSLGLTELTLHWDSFSWDMAEVIQLTDIVTWAPNLARLQGRICGSWQGPRPILQSLTAIYCWILDDSTIISILRSCPNLEIIDVKNIRGVGPDWEGPFLTHPVLLEVMEQNPALCRSVREFMVRPTNLTKASVEKLAEKCPRLTRIGDLECWDVNWLEIEELNHALYHSKSQCSLVVLSFPPQPKF